MSLFLWVFWFLGFFDISLWIIILINIIFLLAFLFADIHAPDTNPVKDCIKEFKLTNSDWKSLNRCEIRNKKINDILNGRG